MRVWQAAVNRKLVSLVVDGIKMLGPVRLHEERRKKRLVNSSPPRHSHHRTHRRPFRPAHHSPQFAHFPLRHSPPHHCLCSFSSPTIGATSAATSTTPRPKQQARRKNHRKQARPLESVTRGHGARTHYPSARAAGAGDGGRGAPRGGGGVRALVPGDPGRGLRARRLRARALLALQEGLLRLRYHRRGGRRLLPRLPALRLRLPAAPLPPVHRPRTHELLDFSLWHK